MPPSSHHQCVFFSFNGPFHRQCAASVSLSALLFRKAEHPGRTCVVSNHKTHRACHQHVHELKREEGKKERQGQNTHIRHLFYGIAGMAPSAMFLQRRWNSTLLCFRQHFFLPEFHDPHALWIRSALLMQPYVPKDTETGHTVRQTGSEREAAREERENESDHDKSIRLRSF